MAAVVGVYGAVVIVEDCDGDEPDTGWWQVCTGVCAEFPS